MDTVFDRGDRVWTLRRVAGSHAGLTIVVARKGYYCDDVSCLRPIDKGEFCGSDGYGAVHFCAGCVTAERPADVPAEVGGPAAWAQALRDKGWL